MISIIVATDKNRTIGANNGLLWRLPKDMRRFRKLTMGKPVIMGRKTYESIPKKFRPLPGRHNIILTRNLDYVAEGCTVVHTVPAALAAAGDVDEVLVGGGAQIYAAMLPLADRIYLTAVNVHLTGDAHFPKLDPSVWQETAREEHAADERHAYGHTFCVLEKRPFHIRALQPGDEAQLETFVLPKIESSMFLLSNMRAAGLLDNGRYLEGTYAAAFGADGIVGVVAHYWNGNLILQAPLELIGGLVETAVAASKRPVRGILGPVAQVEIAMKFLEIQKAAIKLDESEKLYSLKLKNLCIPAKLANGQWQGRRSQPHDLELMTDWQTGFAVEGLGDTDSPALRKRIQESVKRYQKLGRTWILEDGGQPVATSAFNAVVKEAVQIGGVWTPHESRSRGYGRGAVATSLIDARTEGAHTAILFTGEENIPAQKAYEALGFCHIGDYRILLLDV